MRTCQILVAMVCLLGAASILCATTINEGFFYPAGNLAGNGQITVPPWPQPWTANGTPQNRIVSIGSTSISITAVSSSTDTLDEVHLGGLNEGGGAPGLVTFSFDIKPIMTTRFPFDWWTVTVYTEKNLPLVQWTGQANEITCHTPGGTMLNGGLIPNVQLTARIDVDFINHGLWYSFGGVRPLIHPSYVIPSTGWLRTAGCDDIFSASLGDTIDRIEITSIDTTTGGFGPAVEQPPLPINVSIYHNLYKLDATGNFLPMPQRSPPMSITVIANAGSSYSMTTDPGSFVTVSAGGSSSEQTIVNYQWNLDGTLSLYNGPDSSFNLDAAWLQAMGVSEGEHRLNVLVTDSLGGQDAAYAPLNLVPEPATLALLALGALAMLRRRR